jgi:hypothetical protein
MLVANIVQHFIINDVVTKITYSLKCNSLKKNCQRQTLYLNDPLIVIENATLGKAGPQTKTLAYIAWATFLQKWV